MKAICNVHSTDITNSDAKLLFCLGDRLTVGLPTVAKSDRFRHTALQIAARCHWILPVDCNAGSDFPPLYRG